MNHNPLQLINEKYDFQWSVTPNASLFSTLGFSESSILKKPKKTTLIHFFSFWIVQVQQHYGKLNLTLQSRSILEVDLQHQGHFTYIIKSVKWKRLLYRFETFSKFETNVKKVESIYVLINYKIEKWINKSWLQTFAWSIVALSFSQKWDSYYLMMPYHLSYYFSGVGN